MMKSKKAVISGITIFIAISIVLIFLIIASIGEFNIGNMAIKLVPTKISQEIRFWSLVSLWIGFQIAIFYAIFRLSRWIKKTFLKLKAKFDNVWEQVKRIVKH